MIVFSNCTDIELHDFKCVDSPYWCFLIVHCDRVTVRNLKIDNNLVIPNSDGLDIISSSNVNVSDCYISCGDDAVVVPATTGISATPGFQRITRPSRNINFTNCVLRSRSSAIRIGGWDQNVMSDYNFSNITIFDSNCGIGICIRDYAGLENVNFSNFNIHTRLHTGDWWGNGEPIKITAIRGRESVPGAIRNLRFSNIACDGENSVIVYASPECTIENVDFTNFDFRLNQGTLDPVAGGQFRFPAHDGRRQGVLRLEHPHRLHRKRAQRTHDQRHDVMGRRSHKTLVHSPGRGPRRTRTDARGDRRNPLARMSCQRTARSAQLHRSLQPDETLTA